MTIQIDEICAVGKDTLQVATLEWGDQQVRVLNYGARTASWTVNTADGRIGVVMGYKNLQEYLTDRSYMGAIVGRVANRTAGGRFHIDGYTFELTRNEGSTHLHGGINGLDKQFWDMQLVDGGKKLQLTHMSENGAEGYPGQVAFSVKISFGENGLTYEMSATSDRPTPINLAQHNYYNLSGTGDIWDHNLLVLADRYTPVSEALIPKGTVVSTNNTPFDFRNGCSFGTRDPGHNGTDINLVLDEGASRSLPIAKASVSTGLALEIWSDQPCVQLYNGAHLSKANSCSGTQPFSAFSGFCLEPQQFPDALNQPQFTSILIDPEKPYRQNLRIKVGDSSC